MGPDLHLGNVATAFATVAGHVPDGPKQLGERARWDHCCALLRVEEIVTVWATATRRVAMTLVECGARDMSDKPNVPPTCLPLGSSNFTWATP